MLNNKKKLYNLDHFLQTFLLVEKMKSMEIWNTGSVQTEGRGRGGGSKHSFRGLAVAFSCFVDFLNHPTDPHIAVFFFLPLLYF